MAHGAERAEDAGVADEHVDSPEAPGQRRPHLVDAVELGEVKRYQGRGPASGPDGVVDLLEAADRARHQDHVRPFPREPLGDRRAEAAGGTGDYRYAALKPSGRVIHAPLPVLASSDSCAGTGPPS